MPHPNPELNRRRRPLARMFLALCACDGGSPGGVLGSNVTACTLVTPADVEAVMGAAAGRGSETVGVDGITTCQYRLASGSHSVLVRLSRRIGDQEHAAFPFNGAERVAGLGDDAKYVGHAVPAGEPATYDAGSALSVIEGTVEVLDLLPPRAIG